MCIYNVSYIYMESGSRAAPAGHPMHGIHIHTITCISNVLAVCTMESRSRQAILPPLNYERWRVGHCGRSARSLTCGTSKQMGPAGCSINISLPPQAQGVRTTGWAKDDRLIRLRGPKARYNLYYLSILSIYIYRCVCVSSPRDTPRRLNKYSDSGGYPACIHIGAMEMEIAPIKCSLRRCAIAPIHL